MRVFFSCLSTLESYCNHRWLDKFYLLIRITVVRERNRFTTELYLVSHLETTKLDINFKIKSYTQKESHSAFGYSYLYTYRSILSWSQNCSDYHHIHHRWNSHIVLMTHCKNIFENKHDKHLPLVSSNKYFHVLGKFHIIIFL